MIGSVQEIYDRFLRTAERRYPMIVVVRSDAYDYSQRVNDKTANELLAGVRKTGVLVNAILLTSTAPSLIRDLTLEMIKRTGGAYESALTVTALPTKMKAMAARIGQQYKKVSPDRVPRRIQALPTPQ